MILDPWIRTYPPLAPHPGTLPGGVLFSPSPAHPQHGLPVPKAAVHGVFSRWQHIQSKSHNQLHTDWEPGEIGPRNYLDIKKHTGYHIPSNYIVPMYPHITRCHQRDTHKLPWLLLDISGPPSFLHHPTWPFPSSLPLDFALLTGQAGGPESGLDSYPTSPGLRSQLHNRKHHHFSSNPAENHRAQNSRERQLSCSFPPPWSTSLPWTPAACSGDF